MRIDHLVLNVTAKNQNEPNFNATLINNGYPYQPTWGKGTKGFKVANLWLGEEYFEMVRLLRPDGGGWREEWISHYHQGHRGLICLFLDTNQLDQEYQRLKGEGIELSQPEWLQFKWCFNLLTRTMPWRNSYLPFFEGIPMQLGFQQMKDEKALDFMRQYMVPNSREQGITGINQVIIYGNLTGNDREMLKKIFANTLTETTEETVIHLPSGQQLIFRNAAQYKVEVITHCENEKYKGKEVQIENLVLKND